MNILPLGDGKFRTFPMMMDLYGQAQFGNFKVGGSIGGARVAAGSPYARRAQITTNQGKDWNLISRYALLATTSRPTLCSRRPSEPPLRAHSRAHDVGSAIHRP